MDTNKSELFSEMQIDAIGEILNISLGSSATSVSGLLDKRVTITTPTVKVIAANDFKLTAFEPAVGVEINYIDGLEGTNVMVFKESDVKVIVGILLGTDFSDQEFQMDEMSISAICEVMNQMMGASSTALSQFLNRSVNISTPTSYEIKDSQQFINKYFSPDSTVVTVSFNLMIEGYMNTEFLSVFTVELAKELVSIFMVDDQIDTPMQEVIEEPQMKEPEVEVKVNHAPPPENYHKEEVRPQPKATVKEPQKRETAPVNYTVSKPKFDSFDFEDELSEGQANNLGLIMTVPLQISVEIGRTKKKIKEILELSQGSIIELNKQAGSQVDIYVNGQAVAKGDVVVIDDNYGVKITEVLSNSEILEML